MTTDRRWRERLTSWLGRLLGDDRFFTEKFFADERKRMDTKQEETKVTQVIFTGGDYKPRQLASGLIGFRAPYDLPAKEAEVKLNMKCSTWLLFTDGKSVQPGEDIVVKFAGKEDVKAGEVFARALPMLPPSYTIA